VNVGSARQSICLIGGSGFIGRHLAARMVASGHQVTVLTNSRDQNRDMLVLPTLRLVQGDPYDQSDLRSVLAGMDIVVNLVGILNERGRNGNGFRRAHVDLTAGLLEASQATGTTRYVQISSLKADPDGPSFYARTKGESEALVRGSTAAGTQWTIFQPSVIFGREDDFINRFAGLIKSLPVFPLACPNSRLQPVFVGDVVEAVMRAIAEPSSIGNTYQLCGPRVYSLREIVLLIADTLQLHRPVLRLSPTLGKLQARIMEFVPGKPFSMDNYRSLSVHSICDKSGLSQKDLGIQASAMEPVIRQYLGNP
jgi:NADH dehydrogenase